MISENTESAVTQMFWGEGEPNQQGGTEDKILLYPEKGLRWIDESGSKKCAGFSWCAGIISSLYKALCQCSRCTIESGIVCKW